MIISMFSSHNFLSWLKLSKESQRDMLTKKSNFLVQFLQNDLSHTRKMFRLALNCIRLCLTGCYHDFWNMTAFAIFLSIFNKKCSAAMDIMVKMDNKSQLKFWRHQSFNYNWCVLELIIKLGFISRMWRM